MTAEATTRPVALVTGSARGIGRAVAIELARNGYDVVINFSRSREAAQSTAAAVDALGARSLLSRADSRDPQVGLGDESQCLP